MTDPTIKNTNIADSQMTDPTAADLTGTRRWEMADFRLIDPQPCPCGMARRAFADKPEFPATVHRTEISETAQLHYHKKLTETYYFLECEADAKMQLDDEILPVTPGLCLLIPPGVRHRAIGRMTVLIFVTPKFDPADEWFD